jgi:hypothetical protein
VFSTLRRLCIASQKTGARYSRSILLKRYALTWRNSRVCIGYTPPDIRSIPQRFAAPSQLSTPFAPFTLHYEPPHSSRTKDQQPANTWFRSRKPDNIDPRLAGKIKPQFHFLPGIRRYVPLKSATIQDFSFGESSTNGKRSAACHREVPRVIRNFPNLRQSYRGIFD